MAEEIQEAVQILRVTFDGVEIAMKVGSGGMAAMKKAVDVLKGMLDYEKLLGKTSMRKLLIRGGDLQVFQFPTKETKKVKKMAKKYGVLYSMLPDVNKADGMSEIIFHSEAVPRVNMMIKKLQAGKLSSFEEFLKEGDEKELGKLTDFLQEQTREHISDGPGQDRVVGDAVDKALTQAKELQEQAGYYKELADRVQVVAKSRDPNLMDVTISRTLIAEERENAVKTRIPGTWGEGARFIWIPKADIMDIYNGKTMLTFLDRTKEYQVCDKENRIADTINGEKLYSEHYDQVEAAVRERYEKELKRKASEARAHVRTAKGKEVKGCR